VKSRKYDALDCRLALFVKHFVKWRVSIYECGFIAVPAGHRFPSHPAFSQPVTDIESMEAREMKHTGVVCMLVLSPLLFAGCSQESIPTTHLSEVRVTAAGDPVHLAFEEPPVITKMVKPVYPEIAREDGVEGRVVLTIVVDTEGMVSEAKVVFAEPADIFNDAALNAVLQYEFKPAKIDGEPVKVQVGQTIVFTLARRKPL
jgi:TonB family protein